MFKSTRSILRCDILSKMQHRYKVQMVDIFINGKPTKVPNYFTIIQALRSEKVTIPSFCYHERLSIAGNCRMCLINIEGVLKPQIACAVHVTKNMRIRTNTTPVAQAQEGVLEFILADHPLDCPICDQGGECDLQDLSMKYGSDRSRFTDIHFEGKRALENKSLGPFIRAEMTRCIHCTRCIRFGSQVCGIDVLGSTGRGGEMLIGTYVEKYFLSELSGNIVDLCPVGALTSKPYMFKARPWELKRTASIDTTDACGSNITICSRFDRVLRVLPREHDEINQEWLSDKGRYAIDSLEMQRLVTPMARLESKLVPVEWVHALKIASRLICCSSPSKIMVVAGPQVNVETLVAAKDLVNMLGSELCYTERDFGMATGADLRALYSLNISMKDIAQADRIVLIGTNPRFEAPILNVWIRQAYRNNEADIYVVGPCAEYNYHVTYLGSTLIAMPHVANVLEGAKKPLIFLGAKLLAGPEGSALFRDLLIMTCCFQIPGWNVVNVITREASFAGALEAGYKPSAAEAIMTLQPSLIISLGADAIFNHVDTVAPVIYIGFQGDKGTQAASLVLPGCAYTEAGGIYMNMEGRGQRANPAVTPPGKARYDWKIIRALAEYVGICLFYSDQASMACRLSQISPNFAFLGEYQYKMFQNLLVPYTEGQGCVSECPINLDMSFLRDYYCSDIFTYNSANMVKARRATLEQEGSPYSCN